MNNIIANMKKPLLHLFSLLVLPLAAFGQGSLNPPGPPAPTMQTLDQLGAKADQANAKADAIDAKSEKRVPISDATTPGNDSYQFIITESGSYYLTGNLRVTRANGIQVNAEGVTLNLNGFQISRASGSGGNGIAIEATGHRATVRNGSVKGFAFGIRSGNVTGGFPGPRACAFRDLSVSNCTGVAIEAGEGAVLESCRVHDNSGLSGIFTGNGSSLLNCTAANNTSTYGIFARPGSSLINCTAANNTTTHGIHAREGSSLTNCSASNNSSAAGASAGISTGEACTISDSTAHGNKSTAGTSTPTTGMGFQVGAGSTIQRCVARLNKGDGISVSSNAIARENNCFFNGFAGDGAGIHATGDDNRIEGNNVTENNRGIDVDAAGNLIIKNSASGNTTFNYDIVAGNVFGAVVDRTAPASGAVNGNSALSSAGTTDPWANISY